MHTVYDVKATLNVDYGPNKAVQFAHSTYQLQRLMS